MSFLNNCHLEIFEKMAVFCNFRLKNSNFLAIFWQFLRKKWQFSGNFLAIFGELSDNFPEGQVPNTNLTEPDYRGKSKSHTLVLVTLNWWSFTSINQSEDGDLGSRQVKIPDVWHKIMRCTRKVRHKCPICWCLGAILHTFRQILATQPTPVIRNDESGMSNSTSKLGQIGPKWGKSGTFKDQFQYILARRDKMFWNWS